MAAHDRRATQPSAWTLERARFALAATMTPASVALAPLVSQWFLTLTAFVGLSRGMHVTVGDCPPSLASRRCGLRATAR
jgi:hypothetical protein